jgi:hypothetical protein
MVKVSLDVLVDANFALKYLVNIIIWKMYVKHANLCVANVIMKDPSKV